LTRRCSGAILALVQHPQAPWIHYQQTPKGVVIQCNVCGVIHGPLTPAAADGFVGTHLQHQSAAPAHYGAGDAVAAATKAMGIAPCTPCEARRRMLNGLLPRVWRR